MISALLFSIAIVRSPYGVGLLALFMSVGPATGATIHVPADQPTIQQGIDAANDGSADEHRGDDRAKQGDSPTHGSLPVLIPLRQFQYWGWTHEKVLRNCYVWWQGG